MDVATRRRIEIDMIVATELRQKMWQTQAVTAPYFAAAKISAARHAHSSDPATWCEIIRRLDLLQLLVLAERFSDHAPWLAYAQVIGLLRKINDTQQLREANTRIRSLATEMLAMQGLGDVLGVDDMIAATPHVVATIRNQLPETVTAPRLRK